MRLSGKHDPLVSRLVFSGAGLVLVLALLGLARWALARAAAFPVSAQEAWLQDQGRGFLSLSRLFSSAPDGPPLVPLLFAAAGEGGAAGLLWFKWAGLAGGLLGAWFVWLLARELVEPKRAFLAALLFATLPAVTGFSLVFEPALAAAVFWGAALLLLAHALRTDHPAFWAMTGGAIGVGTLCAWPVALMVPCLAIYRLVGPDMRGLRRRGPWIALGVAGVLWAPLVPAALDTLQSPALHFSPAMAGHVLLAQLAVSGPVLPLLVLWLAFNPRRYPAFPREASDDDHRRMAARCRFYLSFSLPVPFFLAAAALAGLEVPGVAGVCAASGFCLLVVDRLVDARRWRGVLPLLVGLHVILGAGFLLSEDSRFRAAFQAVSADRLPLPDDRAAREVSEWLEVLCRRYEPAPILFRDPDVRRVLGYYRNLRDEDPAPCQFRDAGEPGSVVPGALQVEFVRESGSSAFFPLAEDLAGYLALEGAPAWLRGAASARWLVARAVPVPDGEEAEADADPSAPGSSSGEISGSSGAPDASGSVPSSVPESPEDPGPETSGAAGSGGASPEVSSSAPGGGPAGPADGEVP